MLRARLPESVPELHGPRVRLWLRLYALGVVLRRQLPPDVDLWRVLHGWFVHRLFLRDDRVAHTFRDHAGGPPTSLMLVAAACAMAFVTALPQLCSP